VLLAAAVSLRLVGLGHGLPHRLEPDAELGTQVEYMRGERQGGRMATDLATYPHLVARLAVALFEAPAPPKEAPPGTLAEHLERASKNYLDARRAALWLSLLIVPGTFLLARRFLAPGWALFASGLMAFSLLDVSFSQQARAHAPAAGLAPWVVWGALLVQRRGSTAAYLAAGLAAALAVASLQSAVALLPALLVGHLAREKRRLFDPRALLSLALLALSVWLFYPFLFAGERGESPVPNLEGDGLIFANHAIEYAWFDGTGFARIARTLWWYEPALLALLLFAALALALPRAPASGGEDGARRARWVVLAYVVPYTLVIGVYGETYERFVLPLLPFAACFVAFGASRFVARGGAARVAALALCALGLALPLTSSVRLVWLRSQPDTFELAAHWVDENVTPGGERVFLTPVPSQVFADSSMELPLARTAESLKGRGRPGARAYNVWAKYLARLPEASLPVPGHTLEWLAWNAKTAGVPAGTQPMDFLAANPRSFFSSSGPGLFVAEDHRGRPLNVTEIALRAAFERYGTRLARFEPDASGFPFGYQDRTEEGGRWPHVTWRTLTAERTGPAIEVWRVDPGALQE
jgi:hypothetical protein